MDVGAQLISTFLVGCRIGGCLMLMPGFSNARVPARVRLLLAVVMALAVSPIAIAPGEVGEVSDVRLLRMIAAETVTGAILGFVGRIYLAALSFMAIAVAGYIGINGVAPSIDGDEPIPALGSLVIVVATLVLLLLDLHRFLMTTVIESYVRMPLAVMPDPRASLSLFADAFQGAFLLGLQVTGPFVVYAVIVNLIFGILGKLIPQIPSYFVSVPFMIVGGLVLLYVALGEMIQIFARAVRMALTSL